jgi:tRNA(Arg) A34 adenosine deaminase TadA
MPHTNFTLTLPRWVSELDLSCHYPSPTDKLRLAIDLARRNVSEATGGPFGAAVFERSTGKLVAAGVNLVLPARASVAHAEIVALTLAQQSLGSHDLSPFDCELATSVEPCAMCLGAIAWSGVGRVICGARDADARAVGFDEGAKPPDWVAALTARGIEVLPDVLRAEASAVLEEYRRRGGTIYNPSR